HCRRRGSRTRNSGVRREHLRSGLDTKSAIGRWNIANLDRRRNRRRDAHRTHQFAIGAGSNRLCRWPVEPILIVGHVRSAAIEIVPLGHPPRCLLTHALAGTAEDALINVLDPDTLAPPCNRERDVDKGEGAYLILLDDLAPPQKIGEERL